MYYFVIILRGLRTTFKIKLKKENKWCRAYLRNDLIEAFVFKHSTVT